MSDGLTVVDKPPGWTSHDVVARMRRLARTRRVGHAGTLDPMATGVLVLGVNKATRLLHHLVLADKAYTATIRLGQSTVSDDAEGDLVAAVSAAAVAEADVHAVLAGLRGHLRQVPSAVSAIKVDGQRAYQRVRDGDSVHLEARSVTVSRFEVVTFNRPSADLVDIEVEVECSSGTYIRALARDLGVALGVGGHLTVLRRTRVGAFTIDQALTLDALGALDDLVTIPLAQAVARTMAVRQIDDDEARALSFGKSLAPAGIAGTYGAVTVDGGVVALLVEDGERARPVLVFTAAG